MEKSANADMMGFCGFLQPLKWIWQNVEKSGKENGMGGKRWIVPVESKEKVKTFVEKELSICCVENIVENVEKWKQSFLWKTAFESKIPSDHPK